MKTWHEVQRFINYRKLPYSVFTFADKQGRLIELSTGRTVAETVADAEQHLRENE